jgi:hypothetical protein
MSRSYTSSPQSATTACSRTALDFKWNITWNVINITSVKLNTNSQRTLHILDTLLDIDKLINSLSTQFVSAGCVSLVK